MTTRIPIMNDNILHVPASTDCTEWKHISDLFRLSWFRSVPKRELHGSLRNWTDQTNEYILTDGWCATHKHLKRISEVYFDVGHANFQLQPIPVPLELQVNPDELTSESNQHLSPKASSRRALASCLDAINTLTGPKEWDFGPWTLWDDSQRNWDKDVSRFFVRPDVSDVQKMSIVELYNTVPQPGEFANAMGALIGKVLGESSRHLTSMSIDNDGAFSVKKTGELPLVVIVSDGSPVDSPSSHAAWAYELTTQNMEMAMLLFLKHYYHSQGWNYNHEFTDETRKAPMDPRLFTFGVFISNAKFSIFSFMPWMDRAEPDEGTPSPWLFTRQNMMQWEWIKPGTATQRERLQVINAILEIEQHTHELAVELNRVFKLQ